jgi:hypothetical protein
MTRYWHAKKGSVKTEVPTLAQATTSVWRLLLVLLLEAFSTVTHRLSAYREALSYSGSEASPLEQVKMYISLGQAEEL